MRQGSRFERVSLGVVYVAFTGMIALPLVKAFAEAALIGYMPLLLVLLLALPPAFYHFIAAKTAAAAPARVPWRDLALPAAGGLVCIGYWLLPAPARETMLLAGDLPPGFWPAALALATFALILIWLIVSFVYLVAILRRLAAYRIRIRDLYSDADERDLRWVDVIMVLLVLVWSAGAISLADDNLGRGTFFVEELFLMLIAAGLLLLTVFAPTGPSDLDDAVEVLKPPVGDTEVPTEEGEPDPKYARSALTSDHAAKLANRIETAMRRDKLHLDPNLSLQRLSQQVGALPNQVSQTLNQEIGATFFDYVARWRIEASKPLITAGEASVLTVALDVGFNSRSTFYKAFKRETGMTPKSYRAMHQNPG